MKTLLILESVVQANQPQSGFAQFVIPLLFFFLIFYFLLIRPQQKRMKTHREFLSKLKKGDEVITSSGMYGKIVGITESIVTLEIAEGVKIKIDKGHIQGYWNPRKKEK